MKNAKLGIFSVVLASVCCVAPALLALLGLGSLGFGAFLGKYHIYFQAGAVVILVFSWFVFMRDGKRVCNLCDADVKKRKAARNILTMVTVAVALFLGLNLYTGLSGGGSGNSTAIARESFENTGIITLPVEGMTCFSCEITISKSLKRLDGVIDAKASARDKSVRIKYDPAKVTPEKMVAAVNKAGYKAGLPEQVF